MSNIEKRLRSSLTHVLDYFKVEEGHAICQIDCCGKKLNNKLNTNLKRHIVAYHGDVAVSNNWLKAHSNKQYTVQLNREQVIKDLVRLVTEDGLPLSIFGYQSFQNLLHPIFGVLNLNINPSNILLKIAITAKCGRELIKKEVSNKLVCLKVDSATRHERSILGINIQYIMEGKIVVRTLSMMELSESQTGERLKNEIIEILRIYDIPINRIYSCTTDNGANMLKAIELLSIESDESPSEFDEEGGSNIEEDFIFSEKNWTIQSIKYAPHTLQLCVQDAMNDEVYRTDINTTRNIVKKLRTKIFRSKFLAVNKKIPCLDVVTRWSSTFNMLQAIVEDAEFIQNILLKNNYDLYLEFQRHIEHIKIIHSTLKPVAIATKLLQQEQLIFGDLYKIWLELELELQEMNESNNSMENLLLVRLIANMKKRKEKLFDNDIFLAAIYLDPRFNYLRSKFLSDAHKLKAKKHLIKLSDHLKQISNNDGEFSSDLLMETASSPTKLSKLEAKIREEEFFSSTSSTSKTLESKLNNLCNRERIPFNDTSILSFWEEIKTDAELYHLSQVVLAAPATQVSVERAFSALAHILTPTRTRLTKEHLNDILFVKLNKDVIENLNLDIYKNSTT